MTDQTMRCLVKRNHRMMYILSLCLICLTFLVTSGCSSKDDSGDRKIITNSIGMKLVYIQPGEFMMGSPSSEVKRDSDEPQHKVEISKGFYMGIYEVTQAQYRAVTGKSPSKFKGKDLPVEGISWNDAIEFCEKLSKMDGKTYRLPTEAQWEYACRAGTTTPYNTGKTISTDQACYENDETTEVGSFKSNPWGLYDMHGNVWEWCSDWYDKDYNGNSRSIDPTGPASGTYHVLRGGSWQYGLRNCRSANRGWDLSDDRRGHDGFRVVISLDDESIQDKTKSKSTYVTTIQGDQKDVVKNQPLTINKTKSQNINGKYITNSIGMKLTHIQPGELLMGSPSSDQKRYNNESQHKVQFSKGFYMGIYEVTQAQYRAVTGKSPSKFKGDDLPVEKVSWGKAVTFCEKLSKKEGKTYRLPTEAEWEYACRAGTTTSFTIGETINTEQANYKDSYTNDEDPKKVNKKMTTKVGSFKPNIWGLYDMHGNVSEWCSDWFESDYYGKSSHVDPVGPHEGDLRVLRGGSCFSDSWLCRSANRSWSRPGSQYDYVGFRVVCDEDPRSDKK